ncbi:MAG: HPr family phosphocarrier protein [Thermotaleaceae bacterium]
MQRREAILQNESGLHARPASIFVKEASKYLSQIKVIKAGKEYNAKSIVALLSMGAGQNESIIIQADGQDEEIAVKELYDLLYGMKE